MEYIRGARQQSGYNPNTRHTLYGMDADLILLALVSHDPHFTIIREILPPSKKQQKAAVSSTKTPKQIGMSQQVSFFLREVACGRRRSTRRARPRRRAGAAPWRIARGSTSSAARRTARRKTPRGVAAGGAWLAAGARWRRLATRAWPKRTRRAGGTTSSTGRSR